jgi:selenoprotein W-related protein
VLLPSSGGRHEITIDGELVHSKAATGKHPDPDAIIEEVRRRLDGEETAYGDRRTAS